MQSALSRRKLLQAVGAGAVVLGFDPRSRSWVTEAHASGNLLARAPQLDGELIVEPAALAAAADDYGHIISRMPMAVLRPGSVEDIRRIVRFARVHDLQVAARGQGHSTYGQPQVQGGIVVDMSTLNTIHAIDAQSADVDAGVAWSDLVRAGIAVGGTVPVTTDYIELSVGGTLAIGGIGARSPVHGLQVDNVLELDVVTGRGDLQRCSPTHQPKLFNAVLGGLGQFGIITRVRLRQVPAPSQARFYVLNYQNLEVFTADQERLVREGRFDGIQGGVVADGSGGWTFQLEATKLFTEPAFPDDAALLAGLNYDVGGASHTDMPYFAWVDRLSPLIAFLKSIGVWGFPHPWFDVFVPASQINGYMSNILSGLTLEDTGQGPVLLRPILTRHLKRPFVQVGDEEVVFLFDILRTAPPVPAEVQRMVAQNRTFFEQARDLGGKRYPMSAIPFSKTDWREHFGASYGDLLAAKRRYDPHNLMTPGQGIF